MHNHDEAQDTLLEPQGRLASKYKVAVLLIAHAPAGSYSRDRCELVGQAQIGRSSDCEMCIAHRTVSRWHARVVKDGDGYWFEDQGSKNGSFVDGVRVEGRTRLAPRSVIRLGQAVFVFLRDGSDLIPCPQEDDFGLAGKFYRGSILRSLHEAAVSSRHVLLAGPSGSGKELAAKALSSMLGDTAPLPFVVQNCAQFASEEEASTSLFGVRQKVFSGVDARSGLIEAADGGILFLDEAHGLHTRVQRALLRIIEDGELRRIGDPAGKPVQVRFVLASNIEDETFGLTHDLCARLRAVSIQSLAERVADVPEIFDALLAGGLRRAGIDTQAVLSALTAVHYEALCLRAVGPTNIRALVDIADRIVSRLHLGNAPQPAVDTVMSEQLGVVGEGSEPAAPYPSQVPTPLTQESSDCVTADDPYEAFRSDITATYWQTNGNVSAIARMLQDKGIACSRRRLAACLVKWGLRRT